jgi:sec-independent protein translocase protein TatA
MNTSVLLFLNIGGQETILILVAVLLLFGGKKLPELARGLGKGIREFKDATEDVKSEIQKNINAVQDDLNTEIKTERKEELPAVVEVPEEKEPETVEAEQKKSDTVVADQTHLNSN